MLSKFNYANGTLTQVPLTQPGGGGGLSGSEIVYEWAAGSDEALTPVMAVDDNVASSIDTAANGQTYTQTDPSSGNVYIAWATIDTPPSTNPVPPNFNPNRIVMVFSADGGKTFSSQVPISNNGNVNNNSNVLPGHEATPQIAISQGRPKDTVLYGPNDTGVPGGQVNVVWDDYGTNANAGTPSDILWSDAVSGGFAQQFSPTPNTPIMDAIQGVNGAPDTPVPTPISVPVDITSPLFGSVTHVNVSLNVTAPTLGNLSLVLVPPSGSGLQDVTLFLNNVNSSGTTLTGQGITGANLGITNGNQIGTVFDDNAARNITSPTAAAPYIGTFQPEGAGFGMGGGTFANYTGALPTTGVNGVNGTWTLLFTDYRFAAQPLTQFLNNATITFTSGLVVSANTQIINGESSINLPQALGLTSTGQIQSDVSDIFSPGLIIRGSQTAPFPVTSAAAGPTGIGPGLVIASDNTLGAYSPYEGRLYVAFAARQNINGNAATNTDIFLMYSNDGGATWHFDNQGNYVSPTNTPTAIPVNDDLGVNDGFSAANGAAQGRPQFEPSIAVDVTTGTLVMSWYDARNDPALSRVATYVTYSVDGGNTFSPQVYANIPQQATDAITGTTDILGPVPDNESPGNPLTEATFGFGTRQGLAVYGGVIYPAWSGNVNGGTNAKSLLNVMTARVLFPTGPRIISSTQGPVGLPGDSLNNSRAADGGPEASAFIVTFDRFIDPSTFTPKNVTVTYRDTTTNDTNGGTVPVNSVVPLNLGPFGATEFQVTFTTPQSGVGTYSYSIVPNPSTGLLPSDRIRTEKLTVVPNPPAQTFTATGLPVPLPVPGATGMVPITVSGFAGNQVLQNITVTVSATAGFDEFLALTLVSPSGTTVSLLPQFSAFGTNLTNTTFTDSGVAISTGTAPYTGSFLPAQPLGTTLQGQSLNGTWELLVTNQSGVNPGSITSFSVTIEAGTPTTAAVGGNQMDQKANGTHAGYSIPNGSGTLPLIVSGPHIVSSSVPGAPATSDNLVQNATVSAIDVVFDRNMQASSFTAADVLRVIGPDGLVPGPYTVMADPPGTASNLSLRTFQIGFPTQSLSGTYVVTLASSITSVSGFAVDNNLNAGVDLLNGTVTGPTTPVVYNATIPVAGTPIPPGTSTVSTLTVPDSFLLQGVTLQLNITAANDPDLAAILIAPNGTQVKLFTNVGSTGTHANFTNTIFDDSASTPIQNGGPPFFGRFNPQQPLGTLNGTQAAGTWRLVIDDTNPMGTVGTLNSWSLTLLKGVPNSGLGEPVADQSNVSFRIFSMSPTDPLSSSTWTPVGPTSVAPA